MMRGRCSKQGNKAGLEIEKLDNKLTEEPPLSGAYIRSLVKQLTTSKPKDPLNCANHDLPGDGFTSTQPPPPPQPPQRKKQARKRLHTSRPYQERLLNMAEARREIVTALKVHRAAMKQQQQQQQQQTLQTSPQPSLEQEVKLNSGGNSRNNDSNCTSKDFPRCMDNVSYSPFPNPYSYPNLSVAPPLIQENLNFQLPSQTLGLNLNFQDFNNLDAIYFRTSNPSIYSNSSSSSSSLSSSSSSYSSSSSSPCPSISVPRDHVGSSREANPMEEAEMVNSGLHPTLDDKEMAEMRSIGEQHQMELNDTLNLATSAWWFKFLKTTEEIGHGEEKNGEDYGCYPFDEVMEFPAWLNANESCLQQHLNDHYSEDYFQNHPALPCMGIEEIEGKDVEWLARED